MSYRIHSCAALLLLILAPVAGAVPSSNPGGKIEPELLLAVQVAGRTGFIVSMTEKADLTPAGSRAARTRPASSTRRCGPPPGGARPHSA